MTRFIFLADTHFGADPIGWHRQPAYPERLGRLLDCLRAWMEREGPFDFVLHGGDMVDSGAPENIRDAAEAFRFPVPVRLCLGNHDLSSQGALETWLADAAEFFPNGGPDYSVDCGDFALHVMPNQWEDRPYLWEDLQDPRFLPEQLARVRAAVSGRPDVAHMLCTHTPVMGVPVEQTGLDEPYHQPGEKVTGPVFDLLDACPSVRCVLGGHSHANSNVLRNGVRFVTAAAFMETPFEFKVFEVGPGAMRMRTVSLEGDVGFAAEYDEEKAYVTGRDVDRGFEARF